MFNTITDQDITEKSIRFVDETLLEPVICNISPSFKDEQVRENKGEWSISGATGEVVLKL